MVRLEIVLLMCLYCFTYEGHINKLNEELIYCQNFKSNWLILSIYTYRIEKLQ